MLALYLALSGAFAGTCVVPGDYSHLEGAIADKCTDIVIAGLLDPSRDPVEVDYDVHISGAWQPIEPLHVVSGTTTLEYLALQPDNSNTFPPLDVGPNGTAVVVFGSLLDGLFSETPAIRSAGVVTLDAYTYVSGWNSPAIEVTGGTVTADGTVFAVNKGMLDGEALVTLAGGTFVAQNGAYFDTVGQILGGFGSAELHQVSVNGCGTCRGIELDNRQWPGATLLLDGVSWEDTHASVLGGAVHTLDTAVTVNNQSTFSGVSAGAGGAFAIEGGSLDATDITISDASGELSFGLFGGGAVGAIDATVNLTRVTVDGASTLWAGGAFGFVGGTAVLTDVDVLNTFALIGGAAVVLADESGQPGTLTINGGTFDTVSSLFGGGALYVGPTGVLVTARDAAGDPVTFRNVSSSFSDAGIYVEPFGVATLSGIDYARPGASYAGSFLVASSYDSADGITGSATIDLSDAVLDFSGGYVAGVAIALSDAHTTLTDVTLTNLGPLTGIAADAGALDATGLVIEGADAGLAVAASLVNPLSIADSRFVDDGAGAIFAYGDDVTLVRNRFCRNRSAAAAGAGPGFLVLTPASADGVFSVKANAFVDNTAKDASIVWGDPYAARLELWNNTFANNAGALVLDTSADVRGNLFVDEPMPLTDGTVIGNGWSPGGVPPFGSEWVKGDPAFHRYDPTDCDSALWVNWESVAHDAAPAKVGEDPVVENPAGKEPDLGAYGGPEALGADQDFDGDGFVYADDCDDAAKKRNPDAEEINGNGLDDDCDELIDECDQDGDGFLAVGCTETDIDCDDESGEVFPGALEVACDGIDQDCSGADLCDSTSTPGTDDTGATTSGRGPLFSGGGCDHSGGSAGAGALVAALALSVRRRTRR